MLDINKINYNDTLGFDFTEAVESISKGNINSFRHILDKGLHPDTADPTTGLTLFHIAVALNRYEFVLELIIRDVTIDIENHDSQTALMIASLYGHDEIVSLLLLFGADPNHIDKKGQTALMLAAREGHARVIGELIDCHSIIDLDKKDEKGKSALDWAKNSGNENCINLLLAASNQNKIVQFHHRSKTHNFIGI